MNRRGMTVILKLHICTITWNTEFSFVCLARVCWLSVFCSCFSTMQPFVLTAATTSSCLTRKGSVPETCTPSSWRWPTRKYDLWPPSGNSLLHSLFSSFLSFLFYVGGGRRSPSSHFLSWQTLLKRASGEGRTKKEKHRLAANTNTWQHQQGCRLLSLVVSWGLSPDRGTQMPTWLPNQTLDKRGKVLIFLWTDNMPLFKTSSEEFTQNGYFYWHRCFW